VRNDRANVVTPRQSAEELVATHHIAGHGHGDCRRASSAGASDAGSSLVEILMGVVILGTVGMAVLTGLMTTIVSADRHRDLSTGSTVLVDGLEFVKASAWSGCAAGVSAYDPPDVTHDGLTWSYTISIVSSSDGTYGGQCIDSHPLQKVAVRVHVVGTESTLSGDVVKRNG
jgi:hypothetical protein